MNDQEISSLHGKPVLLRTQSGPVAFGKLYAEANSELGAYRISVKFETEEMHCLLGIPMHRHADLLASWNGTMYEYMLPSGNDFWIPKVEAAPSPSPTVPTIETFPLPPPVKRDPGVKR